MLEYKRHIVSLFNAGVLTVISAQWYTEKGYAVIWQGGKVVDIVGGDSYVV